MPPETVRALDDLELTGPAGPVQDETLYGTVDDDGKPVRIFEPPAPPPASEPNAFDTPLVPYDQFYPPPMSSFEFPAAGTVPIDPMLADASLGLPAVSGPGGGFAGFQPGPWEPSPTAPGSLDNTMVSADSLPQYNPTISLVSGMSSFEPFVNTTWSSDGSLPSARRATTSSTLSMRGVSTPASSRSPASPGIVSGRTAEQPLVASRKASPNQLGMRRAGEDPHNKKRRQSSGLNAPQKKSGEQGSQRNNSLPGHPVSKAPLIAPAGHSRTAISSNNDDDIDKNKKSANNKETMMTGSGPPEPPPPSSSSPPSSQPASSSSQQPDSRARNRAAANRCRAKSKVAVAELEATERAMSSEHQELALTAKGLRDEVLTLKNQLLMHGNCDDDVIQQYLANTARMVGSGVMAGGGVVGPGPPMMPGQVGGGGGGGGGVAGLSSSVAGGSRMGSGFVDMPSSSSAPTVGAGRGLPRDRSRRH
ncbi:hypothetical protein Daus18300_009667 [Diaporthe australafricana]|uniref:BZIP domain-containing protein n=1 Tax=Diaporthe australafricana TaxID=127596 RepID=A0ABR3WDC9_9PEZI